MSQVIHSEDAAGLILHSRQEIEQRLLGKVSQSSNGLMGTEQEFFVTGKEKLPPTFDQVEMIFERLAGFFSNSKVQLESGRIVGVHIPELGDYCLEPGGQIEIASKPCENLHELRLVNQTMRMALDRVAEGFDMVVTGTGHMQSFEDTKNMPRSRYDAYKTYCDERYGDTGAGIFQSMRSVCGVQINVDPMGDDFHEIYRSLLLLELANSFAARSDRQRMLQTRYAALAPEQMMPIFSALEEKSNEGVVRCVTDRLLQLRIPFLPDSSPQGYLVSSDVYGYTPTLKQLMDKGELTAEIFDNALSVQLMMPNLRRHGVLETRAPDSVQTTDELMEIADQYVTYAYSKQARQALLRKFKEVDTEMLQSAYLGRFDQSKESLYETKIGRGLKVRDLVDIVAPSQEICHEFKSPSAKRAFSFHNR